MKTRTTLVALAIIATAATQAATFDPNQGLLAYYPFNGNANDASGNGKHLKVNGATLDFDRSGSPARAYSFNGLNNWIQTEGSIVRGQMPLTFSFWAKSSSSAPMDVLGIANPLDSDKDLRIKFNTPQLNNRKGLSFKNASHMATYPFNSADSLWHHYAMVMGEGNDFSYSNFKAYVDGNSIVAGEKFNWGGWTYEPQDFPLTIGKQFFLGGYFQGTLDDIRIYNRALSDQDLKALFLSEQRNSRYQIIESSFTWTQAKADAEARGGHLATVANEDEWNLIRSMVNPANLWMGASDEAREGQWSWVTDEPFVYSRWAPGEPNNAGGSENFAHVVADSITWNDQNAQTLRGYILEIEAPSVIQPPPPRFNAFDLSRLAFGRTQGLRLPVTPPDRGAFRIETSVDLKNWFPLITFPTNSGPFEFIDSAAISFSSRFYRAVRP